MQNKEIQLSEIWNDDKRKTLKEFITTHSEKQSKEQKLRNELLALQYKFEDLEKAELAKFNQTELNSYENSLKIYRDLKGVIDTAFDEGKIERTIEIAKSANKWVFQQPI